MAKIVAEVDAAGVPLYAVATFSAALWTPFVAREWALFGRFRDVAVSGEKKAAGFRR